MKGISEERLKEIVPRDQSERTLLKFLIVTECQEINPWRPIDENTPKDKSVLLKTSFARLIGQWSAGAIWIDDHGYSIDETPTHWQELPPDPEGAEK